MSWNEITPAAQRDQVTVSCNKYGQSETQRLIMSFGADLVADLQLKAGARFRVYIGGTDQRGQLRLVTDEAGPFMLGDGGRGSLRVVIACDGHLPATPRQSRRVPISKDGPEAYIVRMPDWFGPQQQEGGIENGHETRAGAV